MPQRRNAVKQLRVDAKRKSRNLLRKKKFKDALKTVKKSIEVKDLDKAKTELITAQKAIDKAQAKGVIHKNKAARLKSRVAAKLNAATAA